MDLEARRQRDLWGAALGPASLLSALWGIVLGSDWLLLIALLAMAAQASIAAYGWRNALTHLTIGFAVFALGTEFPIVSGISELASASIPLLALSSFLHALTHFSHGRRLMDRLVESGEFRRDHELLARLIGSGVVNRWW